VSQVLIHVAVAVIINDDDTILISKRAADKHQGNKWEFPGGKVKDMENSQQALCREIREELGIELQSAIHMTDILHEYSENDDTKITKVLLDVYEVREWHGEPKGLEGQPISWVKRSELSQYEFPDANQEILSLLQ
jgi:8-oxo-dGTP diphosphatase